MEKETITITRKFTLYPQGDEKEVNRVYKYIRDGMEVQSYMLNMCISAMYAAKMRGADKDELKELTKHYSHTPASKQGSPYDFDMEKYPTGLPVAGSIPRTAKKALDTAFKKGLKYGRLSLPTFKRTMPLMVHNDFVNIRGSKIRSSGQKIDTGIFHCYRSHNDLMEALKNGAKPDIHIRFANNIMFDFVLGNPHKSAELRSVLFNIFEENYKICDSSIGFDSSGKKIMLNLAMAIPKRKHELDEDTVVGVDLGLSIPAVCALNNSSYTREYIGSYDDFTGQRLKIQAQLRREQRRCKDNAGGHGRKKKLEHLERFKEKERNYIKTQNHRISKRVIEFALKNNAKYIKMPYLKGAFMNNKSSFVLRNWSYYELQAMIRYKAEIEGIEVLEVNAKDAPGTCSVCGKEGEVNSKREFICSDKSCKCHEMYKKGMNTDFNTARNIAMCTDYNLDDEAEEEATLEEIEAEAEM